MKTPRFLIGAALLFWGWQTDFLAISIVMAAVLEAARFTRARWEFSDEDFSRIWTICTLLFLGVAVYAFTDNNGPARIGNFFQNPNPSTQTGAGAATSRTASAMLRWLPMVLFMFATAQAYSAREEIPLSTVSLILRRRWKKAVKLGRPLPPVRGMNVSYPYFAVCLLAASVHPADDNSYFWGFCFLTGWALWVHRVRRFGVLIWATALAVAFTASFLGQQGVGRLQSYIQNLDPEWIERFMRRRGTDPAQTKTQIGRIGQLKLSGKIVIRVAPEEGSLPPEYLREASYRIYSGNSWRAGASRDSFQVVPQETNNAVFILIGKTNMNRAKITSYLGGYSRESGIPIGLLPLPTGAGRLEQLGAFVVKMNNLGAVLAEGPGLVSFNVAYGPGPTPDSSFDPQESLTFTNISGSFRRIFTDSQGGTNQEFSTNPDLFVHPDEQPALEQVIADWNVPFGNRPAAIRAITGFFQSNFTYSTWQESVDFRNNDETPLGMFLTRTRSGHCEYFATATVLLLRQMGVPARYAVGYAVHEKSGGEYVVRLRDGHAWCLVWNERFRTWQDFDTTPESWVEEEAKNASPFQRLSDAWTWMEFQFAKFRWGQSNIRQYMLIALVPVTCLLAYQIFFRRNRKRRNQGSELQFLAARPGLDSEFYLIEQELAQRGVVRRSNEALSDWLTRALAHPEVAAACEPLKEILRLHYRYRFDPKGLISADRLKLRDAVEDCLEKLSAVPVEK
jgi:hypothetical protein